MQDAILVSFQNQKKISTQQEINKLSKLGEIMKKIKKSLKITASKSI